MAGMLPALSNMKLLPTSRHAENSQVMGQIKNEDFSGSLATMKSVSHCGPWIADAVPEELSSLPSCFRQAVPHAD